MKYANVILPLVLLVICIFGCTNNLYHPETGTVAGLDNPSVRILASHSPEAPVSGSFGWGFCLFKLGEKNDVDITAVNERLHKALLSEFTSKGLIFAESEPDIVVSYALANGEEMNMDEMNKTYGDLLKMPKDKLETDMHYERGVLVVDVVDRKTGVLLWRGAIMATLDMSWPENRKQERCDAAIKELLRHYPQETPQQK